MRVIRNVVYFGTLSAVALSLSACETMKKAGDAITSVDVPFYGEDAENEEVAASARTLASTADCPQVAIVEDLKNLTQFETPAQPSPGTKISSVSLANLESVCSLSDKTVAIDMSLTFDGQLGPKVSEWKTQSRSFAYPYFIAVTTPTGEILSKEVFAATLRYEAGETAIAQQEKIRQVIPLRPDTPPSSYEVLVGFQLTDDELNYARMMATNPLAYQDAAPVAEEKPKPKKKMAAKSQESNVKEDKVEEVKAEAVHEGPTPTATPEPAPAIAEPVAQPVPTTTDGNMNASPTSSEVVQESPQPVSQTITPAQTIPAATDPAAQDPAANPAATPEPVTPATDATGAVAPAAPAANPYAPPQTQVIRIKPDGTVEKQ